MLENLVRPSALELAREAVRRGIDVEGMCLHPTYNQRCYSCGKHHGWACVCSSGEKQAAWGRREAKMRTPWFAGGGYATQSPTQNATHFCNTCKQPVTGRGKVCSTCRSRAYRGRRGQSEG